MCERKSKRVLSAMVLVLWVGFASADGVWENDMSTDPDGDGWAVRNSQNAYTMGGGC